MSNSSDDSLPIAKLRQIDRVCDQFEAALAAGKRVKVEDFLGDVAEPERSVLRRELEAVEGQFREKRARNVRPAEDRGREDPGVGQFVRSLVDSGLMSEEEVREFRAGLGPEKQPATAEDLARQLYQQKKLTRFQAQAVYQGKTKGLVLGNYVVLEKLGQGGMGHVYKARHRRMRRVVGLKVLSSSVARDKAAVKRFEREVQAAARLNHPNVVTAYDADEADGVHFLVMEYVDGTDLARLVSAKGRLDVARAIDYVVQAARGLEYAHGEGVVHRDVKPSNLLVDQRGTVKILDMGLARFAEAVEATAVAASLTRSGQVMGTLDYMAPEQAADARSVDHRTDVYSLGCTLFYLLTGRPAYEGDTLAQKIYAHQAEPIPSLGEHRPDVPEALDAAFRKMVAKRPDDRHQSMSEVITELEACRAALTSAPEDTIGSREGPAGGGDTADSRVGVAPQRAEEESPEAGFDVWLNAELPETPTQLRTPPRRRRKINQRTLILGAVGAGVLLLLVLLGVLLRVKTPQGTIIVRVLQADAEISVDDGQITVKSPGDNQPVRIKIAEGEHTLKVSKGGFETYTEKIVISSGGKQTIDVELLPLEEEGLAEAPPSEREESSGLVERRPGPTPETPPGPSTPGWEQRPLEEGFVSLFDGRTLSGWQGDTDGYTVEDGKLVCLPKGNPLLFTTKEYTDFILRFDFKLESGSNNGLAIRSPLGSASLGAMEIQILDDSARQYANLAPSQYHGSIFRVAPAQRGELNPVGEWSSQEVVCQGRRVQVTLNGTTILDVNLDDLDAASVERCPGINRASGHLGFLGHRSRVEFRNIRLKELEPALRRPQVLAPPPSAVAPFSETRAREHQQAWADYLGVPMEMTDSIGVKLVLIPPGEFDMGSSEDEIEELLRQNESGSHIFSDAVRIRSEGPRHRVRITKPFYMGKYEVTVGQFRQFVEATGHKTSSEKDGKGGIGFSITAGRLEQGPDFGWENPGFTQGDSHPVGSVAWDDAAAFCSWVSKVEGRVYRLPTEAEWEYACRAGTTTRWYCGNDPEALQGVGNVADAAFRLKWPNDLRWGAAWDDGFPFTAPVGQFQPNAFGLHDMHGNAQEWCVDWFDVNYYRSSPVEDPCQRGVSRAAKSPWSSCRVFRGGGMRDCTVICCSAGRRGMPLTWPGDANVGFRVVCEDVKIRPQTGPGK